MVGRTEGFVGRKQSKLVEPIERPPTNAERPFTVAPPGLVAAVSEALRRWKGNEESRRPRPSGFQVAPPGLEPGLS